MAVAITQAVEDLLVSALTDPQRGLAVTMSGMVIPGSPWGDVEIPDLDLTDDGNHQLLRAWVSLEDYLNTTSEQLPIAFVHVNRVEDQHVLLGAVFSGVITCGIDILLSSPTAAIDPMLEKQGNLVNDAMHSVLGPGSLVQTPNPIGAIRKVGLSCVRTPQKRAGDNWVLPMLFTLPMQVNPQAY